MYNEIKLQHFFWGSATILVTLFGAENEISKRLEWPKLQRLPLRPPAEAARPLRSLVHISHAPLWKIQHPPLVVVIT